MLSTILWDIDGTLLNFHKAERWSIVKCFSDIGFTKCDDAFLERYSKLNRRYWDMLEHGEISIDRLLTERFTEFFSQEHIPLQDAAAFNHAYQTGLGKVAFPNDDSIALIKKLKGRVKQFAVTNGTAHAQHLKLKTSGLDQLLDGAFISQEIGFDKPKTEFFDAVFSSTGIDKKTTAIVGDSLTSDIAGGNSAGIFCMWYNPEGKKNEKGVRVDAEIKNLWEIESFL